MFSSCPTKYGAATLACIFPLLATIIYWALFFVGAAAVIMIIIGGIRFITSGGDAKRVEGAKKTIAFAILGLVLVFTSFLIVNLIAQITGVACLSTNNILSFTTCQ